MTLTEKQLLDALKLMYYHFGHDDIEEDNIYHPDAVKAIQTAREALQACGVDTRKMSEEE